ncbi:hypothetical protein WKI72_16150 [Candidatus Erwinia dacicola]|uniref:Uncharacterized protein n=2 Tax=Candidatus Erwinia dacicola TaxID=252393 RepID=A0A1E7YUR7_9GAMM|nr:hypothetical protein [Candidatus Erwinia dacicola]OFC58162.1 hypothetical protein BBW68_03295 [Candidatus Erwinia dacicola]
MSKMTFVVDFPDGQEPTVSAATDILGGKLVSAAFADIAERYDLTMAARLALQCGIRWDRVLHNLVCDNDWDYLDTRPNAGAIIVPSDRVEEVRELVKELVPVWFSIDVRATK